MALVGIFVESSDFGKSANALVKWALFAVLLTSGVKRTQISLDDQLAAIVVLGIAKYFQSSGSSPSVLPKTDIGDDYN